MTLQSPEAPCEAGPSSSVQVDDPPGQRDPSLYLFLLNWSFAIFSSTRLLTYLPTLWAIHSSADSSQHSLWTWATWVGSNASMAAWLFEHNHRRFNKAIVVTMGNSVMCLATCILILWYR